MSRVIKFRAWDGEKYWYNIVPSPLPSPTLDVCKKITDYEPEYYNMVDIIEGVEAIEQYTGLKDKDGKEIYEGDIVEFGLSGRAERGYVAYADEYASFEVYSKRDFIFGCLFGHAGKVIGNIHENPELLEVKNE